MAILKTLPDLIASSNHNTLFGLGNDDHTQYILVDGTRAFTGSVSGIAPTLATHLTTKQYVDDTIASISHDSLSNLLNDDHTQYHNDARADLWLTGKSTTDISEGTNLYYTEARADLWLTGKTTTDVLEGANLYYTEARVTANANVAANTAHISNTLNPHTTTLTQVLAADSGTDATVAEIEELTDGSETSLHTHAVADHGSLNGLGDDDHTQYHNDTRGDVRYYLKSQVDTLLQAQDDADEISFDPSTSTLIATDVQAAVEEAVGRLDTAEANITSNSDHGNLAGLADDDHTQYILVDGTRALTGVLAGVTPTLDAHLTTKLYVDNAISSLTTDHGSLTGLGDDDHTQYTLADGTRAFTGVVSGITPTLSAHLATKGYVDSEISALTTDHGSLTGLADDDHTQYILVDGTRSFSGVVSGVAPTLGAHLTTKDYVDTLVNGISWQEPVLDRNLVAAPGSPTTGDRYIIAGTGGGWSGFTINDIVEYDGSSWNNITPVEGVAVFVEDEDVQYVFNDSNTWVRLSSTINHSNLTNLTADVHTQYLLADGSRTLTGNLSVSAAITIDGRDISADGSILDTLSNDFTTHIAIGAGKHAATSISFAPNGDIAATTVQAAIQEVRDDTDTKLSGKVTSVNTLTGVVVLEGDDIDSNHTSVNYTAATAVIDDHFAGIDTELGDLATDITNATFFTEAATILTPISATSLDMGVNSTVQAETFSNPTGENLSIINTTEANLNITSAGGIIFNFDSTNTGLSSCKFRANGSTTDIIEIFENGNIETSGTILCDNITFNGGSATHSVFTSNGDILVAADQTVPDRNVWLRATDEVRLFVDSDNDDTAANNLVVYTGVTAASAGAEVLRAGNTGLHLRNTSILSFDQTAGMAPSRKVYASTGTTEGEMIAAVTSTAGITVTLASADVANGIQIFVKDEGGNAGTNNITIATEGAETIDGVASVDITADYGVLRLYSDGTNWFSL